METLLLHRSFQPATSLPLTTTTLARTRIPSSLLLLRQRPNHSIVTRNSKTPVIVPDRLNNTATPWLMLPSVTDKTTGEPLDCFYSLADGQTVRLNRKTTLQVPDTATCIASTMGWLGFVDSKDGKVYLSNPFLKDVVELPSLETLPLVMGVRRDPITNEIIHFKVRSSDYDWCWDGELDPYYLVKPENMVYHMSNLALSSGDPRGSDCVVMALQGNGFRRLAYCPISRRFSQETDFDGLASQFDQNCWTGLQEDYVHCPGDAYNQVVYDDRRGLFYAMFSDTGILAFDLLRDRGRRSKMVFNLRKQTLDFFVEQGNRGAWKELKNSCRRRFYLVSLQNGDLLLIVRHYEIPNLNGPHLYFSNRDPHKTVHMDVFRIVYPGDLEPVTCLNNDRAIFIGWNQSFCITASSSPGIRPNCIYFTDDVSGGSHNVHTREQWGHDTGIFNMEDGTITPFYPYEDEQEEKKVPLSVPLFWVAPLSTDIEHLACKHGVDRDNLCGWG